MLDTPRSHSHRTTTVYDEDDGDDSYEPMRNPFSSLLEQFGHSSLLGENGLRQLQTIAADEDEVDGSMSRELSDKTKVIRLRPKTVPARAFRMDSEYLTIAPTVGDLLSTDSDSLEAGKETVAFSERRQSGDAIND